MAVMGAVPEVEDGQGPRGSRRLHRAWTPLGSALAAAGDHWTLMIALQLAPGRLRLTSLQRSLPGVSTGVLERYVAQMVVLGLVERHRFKEVPPRVELELTESGRELLPIAGALARWGMRNLWSPPGERARVGLELLLRLLPVLLEEHTALPDGDVEAVVTHPDPPCRVPFRIENGRLRPEACEKESVAARVLGDRQAWIDALGPSADYAGLRFVGDKTLALAILEALPDRNRA
jgi:DNA-binding HxlR family transcriptional regulator